MTNDQTEVWNKLRGYVIDTWGNKCYYNDRGELHRENGPAIEGNNTMWFLSGELLQQHEYKAALRNLRIKQGEIKCQT